MDRNPLNYTGGGDSKSGKGSPSSKNSNFASMPNDSGEGAFKVPEFGGAEDAEKVGIGNRLAQGKQMGREISSAISGKPGVKTPNKKDDPLTKSQREATDAAKLGVRAGRALAGDERALKELAEHPLDTAKAIGNTGKLLLKIVVGFIILSTVAFTAMFMFISNFSQKHVSQVIKDVAFAPVDVTGARRVAQLFSSTMFGGSEENYFDPVKVLSNLGETGKVKFYKDGKEMTTEEFISSGGGSGVKLTIGTTTMNVPSNITRSTSPETIQFIKDLEVAIKGSNLFANEARLFRSPTAKQIYKQFGINLFRWENNAKDVKTYSDNMKSLYDKVKDLEQSNLSLDDVDESGKQLDSVTETLLSKELPRSQKSVAIKSADIAWDQKTGTQSLNAFAKNVTATEFAISSYCTAKSYIDNYEKIVSQKFVNSQRAAIKLLSSSDQSMVGNVRPKAVSSEAQQMEFFEDARPYLKAIKSDVTNRRPVLNEGQLAYQDPRIIKAVMEGIVGVFENPFSDGGLAGRLLELITPGGGGGLIGAIKGAFSNIVGSLSPDALISYVADRLYPIICSNLSIPNGLIGQILDIIFGNFATNAILTQTRDVLLANGAYELANQLGLSGEPSLFSQPTENFMKFMYRTQKTIEFSGLDDGAELVSKDFEGVTALGNELSRVGGGRALGLQEQYAFTNQKDQRDYAVLKNKTITYRLFSLNNQYSPASIITARTPKSLSGTTKRTQTQFASIFSPVKSYGGSVNKAVAAAFSNKAVAQALSSSDKYDKTVMFGYSVDEIKKMQEDIAFWPKQNRDYVEANLDDLENKYGDCFKPQNSIRILYDDQINMWTGACKPENLSNDEALHYRLYLLDNVQTNSLNDIETVTKDTIVGGDVGPVPGSGDVGDVKNLAQQLLDNPNVTYPYTDSQGVNVRQVLEGVAKTGMGLVNSPDVTFKEVPVSASLLQALVDYAKTHQIGLNALTNGDHSSNSNHYKGIAIDIACTPAINRAEFEAIASKYGGVNNGEVCPDDRHWHYDFK